MEDVISDSASFAIDSSGAYADDTGHCFERVTVGGDKMGTLM